MNREKIIATLLAADAEGKWGCTGAYRFAGKFCAVGCLADAVGYDWPGYDWPEGATPNALLNKEYGMNDADIADMVLDNDYGRIQLQGGELRAPDKAAVLAYLGYTETAVEPAMAKRVGAA